MGRFVIVAYKPKAEVCDYVPLRELPEAHQMFAELEPVSL